LVQLLIFNARFNHDQTPTLTECPLLILYLKEVNENSHRLIEEHKVRWPAEVCHQQTHFLESVPVHEINYKIKSQVIKPDHFLALIWLTESLFREENFGSTATSDPFSHSTTRRNAAAVLIAANIVVIIANILTIAAAHVHVHFFEYYFINYQ